MLPFRGFITGFAIGFVSGVTFRVLAENDFEPVKDVFKTTVGMAQKASDAIAETYGRMIETIDDVRSQLRTESAQRQMAKNQQAKPPEPQSQKNPKKKTAKKTKLRKATQVLHA